MPAWAGSWLPSSRRGGGWWGRAATGKPRRRKDERHTQKNTHQKHTQHTLNRVPALLFNAPGEIHSLADGKLADVAPTLLALMGVPQPREMTGHSLLSEASRPHILAAPRAAAAASA